LQEIADKCSYVIENLDIVVEITVPDSKNLGIVAEKIAVHQPWHTIPKSLTLQPWLQTFFQNLLTLTKELHLNFVPRKILHTLVQNFQHHEVSHQNCHHNLKSWW